MRPFWLVAGWVIGAAIVGRTRALLEGLAACCECSGAGDDEEASGEASQLMHCVKASTTATATSTTNATSDVQFLLLGHSTAGIVTYAAYGHFVNAAYAQARGYRYRLLDAEGSNYEPLDPRWNKVQILLRAVDEEIRAGEPDLDPNPGPDPDPHEPLSRQSPQISSKALPALRYVVWLDSDLIVLHHDSLRLEALVHAHPEAHLLLSRDPRAENGAANTGCIIARVSAFTRLFLSQWWGEAPRRLDGMDQHAFQQLYQALPGGERDKLIALLPPSAVNSDHPVWLMHTPQNPVLHLVGMNSVVRRAVFRGAFRQLCGVLGGKGGEGKEGGNLGVYPTATIAMDAATLLAVVSNATLHGAATQRLADTAAQLEASAAALAAESAETSVSSDADGYAMADMLRALEEVEGRARDLRQRGYGAGAPLVTEACLGGGSGMSGPCGGQAEAPVSVEGGIQWSLYRTLMRLVVHSGAGAGAGAGAATDQPGEVKKQRLRLLQLLADVGLDLLAQGHTSYPTPDPNPQSAASIVDTLLPAVTELAALVSPAHRAHVLYYRFKLLEHRARSPPPRAVGGRSAEDGREDMGEDLMQRELAALQEALDAWAEMSRLGWHGGGNNLLDPQREAAVLWARWGSLQCARGGEGRVKGIVALERAVAGMETAWGLGAEVEAGTEGSVALIPAALLESAVQALLALTLCHVSHMADTGPGPNVGRIPNTTRPETLAKAVRLVRLRRALAESGAASRIDPVSPMGRAEEELSRLCRVYGMAVHGPVSDSWGKGGERGEGGEEQGVRSVWRKKRKS